MEKPVNRSKTILFRVSPEEKDSREKAARDAGMTLSDWCRGRTQDTEKSDDQGDAS